LRIDILDTVENEFQVANPLYGVVPFSGLRLYLQLKLGLVAIPRVEGATPNSHFDRMLEPGPL